MKWKDPMDIINFCFIFSSLTGYILAGIANRYRRILYSVCQNDHYIEFEYHPIIDDYQMPTTRVLVMKLVYSWQCEASIWAYEVSKYLFSPWFILCLSNRRINLSLHFTGTKHQTAPMVIFVQSLILVLVPNQWVPLVIMLAHSISNGLLNIDFVHSFYLLFTWHRRDFRLLIADSNHAIKATPNPVIWFNTPVVTEVKRKMFSIII